VAPILQKTIENSKMVLTKNQTMVKELSGIKLKLQKVIIEGSTQIEMFAKIFVKVQ